MTETQEYERNVLMYDKARLLCESKDADLVYLTRFGSHLYGTNTENSDLDIKGLFLPSVESLLLKNSSDQLSERSNKTDSGEKNTKDDEDLSLWSVHKFVELLNKGDSGAVSLLFSIDVFNTVFIYQDDSLRSFFKDLKVPKRISGMVGFAKAQAYKYSQKGNKYTALKTIVELMQSNKEMLVRDIAGSIKNMEYVEVLDDKVKILHTTFDFLATCGWAVDSCLTPLLKTFGNRAIEASQNNNIDYKSCSHSVRIFMEIESLHLTGKITCPHTDENVTTLLDIKQGKLDLVEIGELIDYWEQRALDAEKISVLSDDSISHNNKMLKNFLKGWYNIYA